MPGAGPRYANQGAKTGKVYGAYKHSAWIYEIGEPPDARLIASLAALGCDLYGTAYHEDDEVERDVVEGRGVEGQEAERRDVEDGVNENR